MISLSFMLAVKSIECARRPSEIRARIACRVAGCCQFGGGRGAARVDSGIVIDPNLLAISMVERHLVEMAQLAVPQGYPMAVTGILSIVPGILRDEAARSSVVLLSSGPSTAHLRGHESRPLVAFASA